MVGEIEKKRGGKEGNEREGDKEEITRTGREEKEEENKGKENRKTCKNE